MSLVTHVRMWFFFWLAFVLFFFVTPLIYGWGYKGWGAPPYRRRRSTPVDEDRLAEARVEQEMWGWLAAFVWIAFIAALIWLVVALIVA